VRKAIFLLAAVVPLAAGCAAGQGASRVSLEIRLAKDEPAPGLQPVLVAKTREKIYLSPRVELDQADIRDAQVVKTPRGPAVGVKLAWSAARRLARLTDQHIGDRLAVLVDGSVVCAPLIKGKTGRSMIIAGDFTQQEAEELAAALSGRAAPPSTRPRP